MFPQRTYRYSLKRGMLGHDVWALQINLARRGFEVSQDGEFGEGTERAVKKFQSNNDLTSDGIAGLLTQRTLALRLIKEPQSKHGTPPGLIKGIVEGESGFMVGAVNWIVPHGIDCGWVQRRVVDTDYTDTAFKAAFDGSVQFELLAASLRDEKERFHHGDITHQRAWELAVLDHNWPAAAQNYGQGKQNWNYVAKFYFGKDPDAGRFYRTIDSTAELRSYDMNTPAQWIKLIGASGITTGTQWADHYIDSKTHYVNTWPS